MKILTVILEMFRDFFKYIGTMILVVIAISYVFTGFGIMFAVCLLEPILMGDYPAAYYAIAGEIMIVGGWVYLLIMEIQRRIRQKEYDKR